MAVYYALAITAVGLGVPLCGKSAPQWGRAAYIAVMFSYMLALSVLREGIGFDYYRYAEMFELARQPFASVEVTADVGFELILRLFAALGFTDRLCFAALAFMCLAPVAAWIYKYSVNAWLSVWLYITLTFFYGTMNFIRQNLALSILLLGYGLLLRDTRKAHALYALVIIAAFFIHASAIIMLPVLLLLRIPFNKWSAGAMVLITALGVIFAQPLLDFFALTDEGYMFFNYHIDDFYFVGLSPVFLILPALFGALLLALYKPIKERFGYGGELAARLSFFGVLIWGIVVKFMVLERFSLFLYIYMLLALPFACESLRAAAPEKAETGKKMKRPAPAKLRGEAAANAARLDAIYAFLLVIILCASFAYNRFGMTDGGTGFHGVFPYRSYIEWIDKLPR